MVYSVSILISNFAKVSQEQKQKQISNQYLLKKSCLEDAKQIEHVSSFFLEQVGK